jgi:CBS domain-containing protein/anti-sigma regulatory factor (Ser/Thr protein kinase)
MTDREKGTAASKIGITKIQELVYELKIKEVMTTPVVTVSPEGSMRDLSELLRTRRISGTPVVEGGRLVGIVSIEDLIKALAGGEVDAPVYSKMTRDLVTVQEREPVIEAVKKFSEYGVGRLPVVDEEGRLVGILTGGDITRGLLAAIGLDYHQEEIQRYRASHIFEDIVSDDTSLILRYEIPSRDFDRGGEASSKIRRTLYHLGGNPQTVRRVGIAAYEAEMNIIIHTTHGGEMVVEIQANRVRIVATDRGPGIEDVNQAMEPGFSTAPEWIRELGFGAGMGLLNIRKCADEMRLESKVGVGSRLEILISLNSQESPSDVPKGNCVR